jgi:hypothetical protein
MGRTEWGLIFCIFNILLNSATGLRSYLQEQSYRGSIADIKEKNSQTLGVP